MRWLTKTAASLPTYEKCLIADLLVNRRKFPVKDEGSMRHVLAGSTAIENDESQGRNIRTPGCSLTTVHRAEEIHRITCKQSVS